VVGNVASDAADSGNPVKVGARAAASIAGHAAVATNDRIDAAANARGQLQVVLSGGAQWTKFNPASSFVPAKEWLVNDGPCIIGRLTFTLSQDEAVDLYAFIYDATSQGAGPIVERFYIPAGGSSVRDYTAEGGLSLDTGCFVILSTESTSMAAAAVGGFLHGIFQST
jgi:hypothetical protein